MRCPIGLIVVLGVVLAATPVPSRAQDDGVLAPPPGSLREVAAAPFLGAESATRRPTGRRVLGDDPYQLLSSDRLLGLLEQQFWTNLAAYAR